MPEKIKSPSGQDSPPESSPVEQEDWEGLKKVEFESFYQNGVARPKQEDQAAGRRKRETRED